MDLPRYCGGKPARKRSGLPSFYSLQSDPAQSLKTVRNRLKVTVAEGHQRKRLKRKRDKAPLTLTLPSIPCIKRLLEVLGLPSKDFAYVDRPRFIERPEERIYEVWTGILPLASFVSMYEANLQVLALRGSFPSSHVRLVPLG